MSKKLCATFSDTAYEALQNGDAVFNNGFRKKNGCYYPEQPTFSPMNNGSEMIETRVTGLVLRAAASIVLPVAVRFANEKLYPFIAEKWDNWYESRKKKDVRKNENSPYNKFFCNSVYKKNVINCSTVDLGKSKKNA